MVKSADNALPPYIETGRLRSQGWEDEQPQRYIRADRVESAIHDACIDLNSQLAQRDKNIAQLVKDLDEAQLQLEHPRKQDQEFIEELRKERDEAVAALRSLVHTPAVIDALNPSHLTHLGNCECPWCAALAALKEPKEVTP